MSLENITLADAGRRLAIGAGIALPLWKGFAAGHAVGTGQPFPYGDPLVLAAGLGLGLASLSLDDKGGFIPIRVPKSLEFAVFSMMGYGLETATFAAGYIVGRY